MSIRLKIESLSPKVTVKILADTAFITVKLAALTGPEKGGSVLIQTVEAREVSATKNRERNEV
jgi:hypothetical protein